MTNLSAALAPVLSSRPARRRFGGESDPYAGAELSRPNGVFAAGSFFTVYGGSLYVDHALAGTLADSPKRFAALGGRVLIMPDKKIWNDGLDEHSTPSVGPLSLSFQDGEYAGESAEKNTIYSAAVSWGDYFRVGDGVTVSGCGATGGDDLTIIIREIDGHYLRFYENSFQENGSFTASVSRDIPELEFMCVNENRIWGCKGDTVWCCKLGDPYNWNVFDGISTDAWSVETGTPGDFTGCVSFLGFPVFFKEDRIFKVYGTRPNNFQLMEAATLGVLDGAADTLAVAGETLYYLSRAGFVAYSGGLPAPVGDELACAYTGGAAASDGQRYYVSAHRADGGVELLVYDTRARMWHREDGTDAARMAYFRGGVYAQCADALWLLRLPSSELLPDGTVEEGTVSSAVEFADYDFQSFDSKYPVRLWLRAEADALTALTVSIRYDGRDWETMAYWPPRSKKSGYFPVPVRRCMRYALQIEADGPWKLYEIEQELYTGADSRRR